MLEHNKERVRRYVEEFQSAGNVETADALVAADIIHHHGPGWTLADTSGREGAKAFITMLRAAFPDLRAVLHDQLGDDDKVMTRKTSTAPTAAPSGASPQPASRSPST